MTWHWSEMEALRAPQTEPGDDAVSVANAWMDSWVQSEALEVLSESFGGPRPSTTSLDQMVKFSAKTWDFRKSTDGASLERNEVEAQVRNESVSELVLECADALGLRSTPNPEQVDYDHLLVLGGLVRACLSRPKLASLLVNGGITTRSVAGIGAYRELRGDEIDLVAEFPNHDRLRNEIDVMDMGLCRAFGLEEATSEAGEFHIDRPNDSWLVRRYAHPQISSVMLVAAPSTDPAIRRANTPDTYKYWAEELVDLRPTDRVLLVTSAIYVPFQGLDAIRMLSVPYGCGVEIVGTPAEMEVDGMPAQSFEATKYLQEVNSTLRSIQFFSSQGSC